jgi:hypothetical protein
VFSRPSPKPAKRRAPRRPSAPDSAWWVEVGPLVVALERRQLELISQAEIDRQAGRYLPVVLEVHGVIPEDLADVTLVFRAATVGLAQQERREGVTTAGSYVIDPGDAGAAAVENNMAGDELLAEAAVQSPSRTCSPS